MSKVKVSVGKSKDGVMTIDIEGDSSQTLTFINSDEDYFNKIINEFMESYVEENSISIKTKESMLKFVLNYKEPLIKTRVFNYILTNTKIGISIEQLDDQIRALNLIKEFLNTIDNDIDIDILRTMCMKYVMVNGKGHFNPMIVSDLIDSVVDNI